MLIEEKLMILSQLGPECDIAMRDYMTNFDINVV